MKDAVAENVLITNWQSTMWDELEGRFRVTAFNGRALYCRKRIVDGGIIELAGEAGEDSPYFDVLAIGDNVGTKCEDKAYRKKLDRPKWTNMDYKVGDTILMPPELLQRASGHPGIRRSPWNRIEFFIEESVPLAIVEIDNG